MTNPKKKYTGEIALLAVTLLWGATFVIVKESLASASPMLFISTRFTFAAILLIPFLIFTKFKFNPAAFWAGSLLGVILFLGFATQTVGLQYTLATKSGFITGSAVVIIPIMQTIIKKQLPSKASIAGVVLVFIGILFLSSGGNSIFTFLSQLGSSFNFGDFLTLLCAICFAAYVVYLDVISAKYEFMDLLLLQIITTAILGFAASFIFSFTGIEEMKFELTSYLVFGILYTSILATLITTALQTKYQKLVTPTKAGLIFSLEPVFAAVLAFFLLKEKITNFGLIGSVFILGGLVITELKDKSAGKHA